MSVNYYLDSSDNDAGHLVGKWATGLFTAKAPQGVNSFDEWAAQLDGCRIFAEHSGETTAEEMVATALQRWPHSRHRNAWYDRGEFFDRGVLFVRHDFC